MYRKRPTTKTNSPTLTSRQIMYQIFSFFDSNMTQGRSMGLTGLLDIELHNDNLKALSNRPGKTHYNPWTGRSLKKKFENICDIQLKKSSQMKRALSLCHNDLFLKKENKSYRNVKGHGE